MERYTLRQMGDAWAVDASYRREIYVASRFRGSYRISRYLMSRSETPC